MLDPGGGSIGGSSIVSSSSTGISVLGWIVAASTVATIYQWKAARPIVLGIVLLVLLGMVLRSESKITAQLRTIFK